MHRIEARGPRQRAPGLGLSAADDPVVACAGSSLVQGLLDAGGGDLVEVARTSSSVHYETGRADVPVLCVSTPDAVRLPASLVARSLPAGPVAVVDGALRSGRRRWQVVRWWVPPRPVGLAAPVRLGWPEGVHRIDALHPDELVGLGPGLTPAGDDVLAGALVTANATGDSRLGRWRAGTVAALAHRRTTTVSRALLHHALTGWATSELAGFVTAACTGEVEPQLSRLLGVGHTSGAALASGVLHVLSTDIRRAAA